MYANVNRRTFRLGLVFFLASILLHLVTMDLSKIIQLAYNINYNQQ